MTRINFHRTVLVFLASLLAAGIANAQTNVNVVNTPTVKVVGPRPSDYVVLSNDSNFLGCTSWFRIDRAGTPAAFTIPTGHDLVITDMEFTAFNTPSTPGTYEALQLVLGPFGEVVLGSFALVDPSGAVATQQHLASGIVMSVLPTCSTGTQSNTIE